MGGPYLPAVHEPRPAPLYANCSTASTLVAAQQLGLLRVRPNILRCASVPYNSTQYEPDHRKNDERCMIATEIFVVFDEAAAAVQPAVGALYDPGLGNT